MLNKLKAKWLLYFAISLLTFSFGCSSTKQVSNAERNSLLNNPSRQWLNLDTVKAGRFDTGKLWTFEYPPVKYFKEAYGFTPSQQWLDDVRMSALRFADYCSASFVSSDGLVMTCDHCARESATEVQKKGENLDADGFYAKTLKDERKVPGLYVEQLVLIKDITKEIEDAAKLGNTDKEKEDLTNAKISEIEKSEEKETGLKIQVVPLYSGARYSLYGYKRYDDVRLVFVPEDTIGFFGGDYDNFTYPRYDLDCAFFRVYDDSGKPLNTEHYFKWSKDGALVGEPIFAVGNPGSTNRLNTVAQLKYLRDVEYPRNIFVDKNLMEFYKKMIDANPPNKDALQDEYFEFSNSLKAYTGMLRGLRNPILLQKKIDFENKFRAAVDANPKLKQKYGGIWKEIAENRNQAAKISNRLFAYNINPFRTSEYFSMAHDMVQLADQLKLPVDQREYDYKGTALDSTIDEIYPDDFDTTYNKDMLVSQLKDMIRYAGANDPVINKITGGMKPENAAAYMTKNSVLTSEQSIKNLTSEGPDAILNSNDPFIYFTVHTDSISNLLKDENDSLDTEDAALSEKLGKALFEVYGTSIPPDATFTLRISDGIIKGFPYNGTIAQPFTTFYGLYDRYYGFDEKYPWSIPEEWKNPPTGFDLSVPINFVATNDIIGGNSGSPVINEKAEIVGLAFDGNIQSLPGDFIYDTSENRMVAVHSSGIIEALKYIYKANRLVDELQNGKIDSLTTVSSVQ
jgi:Peptidase S46